MDTWLDTTEFDKLTQELNPHLQTGIDSDANWQRLKTETVLRKDPFAQTIKTKTPTVLEFDNHCSFTYRRYDGAHWHTELRNLDSKKCGFTSKQAQLRDSLNTLICLSKQDCTLEWYTPLTLEDTFDPQYQLFKFDGVWHCVIDNNAYAQSNTSSVHGKSYKQITFSTRNEPIFTINRLTELLDKLM